MVTIQPLHHLDERLLKALIVGYTTSATYQVSKVETPESIRFALQLLPLEQPLTKHYKPLDAALLQQYSDLAAQGQAFGAFAQNQCVGIALTEPRRWNASLWVLEFHVAPAYQGQGIGRQLMDTLTAHARRSALRCLVCETQSRNVPAIQFYRALGFVLDGLDLSYYTNQDQERGEVAVFMKKRL